MYHKIECKGKQLPLHPSCPNHSHHISDMLHNPAVLSGITSLMLMGSLSNCARGNTVSWGGIYAIELPHNGTNNDYCLDDDSPSGCH